MLSLCGHGSIRRFPSGLEVIGQIEAPGYLEGGDFTAVSQDLAMLGIGLRSNYDAAHQLMDRDLLGARRFAVVRDDFEQHQVSQCIKCLWLL